MRVAVIGGSTVTDREYQQAREVGRVLGDRGHEVVWGGPGGVMEAVCAGARETGGHTVGILPNADPATANDHVETAIATGLGNARNVLVVLNGDGIIAVDGSSGTLSELGHALDMDRPVAGIGTHSLEGIEHVESAESAVDYVESYGPLSQCTGQWRPRGQQLPGVLYNGPYQQSSSRRPRAARARKPTPTRRTRRFAPGFGSNSTRRTNL